MGDYIRGLVVRLHVTPEQDVLFLEGEGDFLTILPGYFMITYPDDAHAPAAALKNPGEVYGKIVAKIPVNA